MQQQRPSWDKRTECSLQYGLPSKITAKRGTACIRKSIERVMQSNSEAGKFEKVSIMRDENTRLTISIFRQKPRKPFQSSKWDFVRYLLHLQTHFWHCDIVIRYCDIPMPFVSQNIRDFPRVMSFVPELCQSSHNTSHNYVS